MPPEATVAAVGEMLTGALGPHVPPRRLLVKPFSRLPVPTSLASVTLIPVVNPSPKVLLLMQAFLLPFSIKMPMEPGPLIVALWMYALFVQQGALSSKARTYWPGTPL